jgi:hypothetical protein
VVLLEKSDEHLLGLNIVFENLLDILHNRMKFQVICVDFLCDLLACRLTDYATRSNVYETDWCEECMSFLPERLNDLQEALR